MSENTPSASGLSVEGETFANDYHWRSTKAKQQLRDRFGRWISLGANVRFRMDGQEQSGVVTSVIDGKAYVDQTNLDGTKTQRILDPGMIRVIASKATLPIDGTKFNDPGNNFSKALKNPDYLKALQDQGSATIARADGYSLAAQMQDKAMGNENKAIDGTNQIDKNKAGGNPILYQLFAPGGRSLGKYGQAAEGDFDAMVASDQGQSAGASPSGGSAPTAVAASIEVTGEEKPYRVPDAVREEIKSTISKASFSGLSDSDFAAAKRLASDSTVSRSDVEWVHAFFAANELSEGLRGGFKGRKWASKIVDTSFSIVEDLDDGLSHPKYQFDDDTFAYFATGRVPGSSLVNGLLAVNYETGEVYTWTPEGFALIPDLDMLDVDEPQIIPIDEMTADEFAKWLDSGEGDEFDILDTDPEERNLFSMADAEIDYEELDRAYSIIAAAGDGVYTPVERSQNAKVQRRAAGGKFGGSDKTKTPTATPNGTTTTTPADAPTTPPVDPAAPAAAPADPSSTGDGADAPKVKKATLPVELPLVADPAARITEWLSTAAEAPVVAAGDPSAAPAYDQTDQATEDAATGPTDEALYFAIVDDVDKSAVLDAIAIVKQNGQPSCFIRKMGAWVASPDTLADLQGSTPPAVAELTDPDTVKNVLGQIDAHDSGADTTADPTPDQAPQPGEVPLAASGYAMPDGSYTIIDVEDLQSAVVASGAAPNIFVKAHIRKRARALNRMDVVPAGWREFSLAEIGELSAARTVYGEFGEIIVAAAGRGHGPGNEAKLRAYWTTGKGALKIRWGTKGDLTRAHRHLSKYVGPDRAWGLAQSYHRDLFGVYNYTHDVATGQYVPHGRKK